VNSIFISFFYEVWSVVKLYLYIHIKQFSPGKVIIYSVLSCHNLDNVKHTFFTVK